MKKASRTTFPSAVHILLLRDGKVLLLKRKNTGYMDGYFSVVAGHLEGDETVHAAAKREALEEAGIHLSGDRLEIVGVLHRRDDDERIDWFLTATAWTGEIINSEPERCEELTWYPLENLPADIIPYVRHGIENYQKGIPFDHFGFE